MMETLLTDIEELSREIFETILETLENAEEDESEIIVEISQRADVSEQVAVNAISTTCDTYITDARSVVNEIDEFSEAVAGGHECVSKNADLFPFMAEVWCGDAYGEEGVDALKLLKRELSQTAKKVNENFIIEKTVQDLILKYKNT